MIIEDLRTTKLLELDVKGIIEKIIEYSPSEVFRGLKKIVILNSDYKKRAMGRHRQRKDGTYEIELMMDSFDGLPTELIMETKIAIFQIGSILFHEIYHHQNNIYNRKRVKKTKDEELADTYGKKMASQVIKKIYSESELKTFKEKILQLQKKYSA